MSREVLLRTVTTGTPIPNAGLDTTTPAGNALFQIMGVFAEFERSMIAKRVRAGLACLRSPNTPARPACRIWFARRG
jgi:DNA invertase Pin-like site-specific DNA recombinase